MYYIKQKFNIHGEVKEYNIPIASLEGNKVIGAKHLMTKGFNADNVKLLGIDKGNLVLPNSENYFDNVVVQDIVIPVITEPSNEDIDVSSVFIALSANFRKQGLPLIIDNGMGFDTDTNKYVPTLGNRDVTEFYSTYTVSSDEARELEYEAKTAKLEAEIASLTIQGQITEEEADAKRAALDEEYSVDSEVEYTSYIFTTKGLTNELSFYNLLMFNLNEFFSVFKKAAETNSGLAGIAKGLMSDEDGKFLFALLSTLTSIQGSSVVIPGIIGNLTINGNTGRGFASSDPKIQMLRLAFPPTWTRSSGIIELLCSYYDMISLMVNSKEFMYKGNDMLNPEVVVESIQRGRGISPNECVAMMNPDAELVLPTYSFTEFRKFTELMIREGAYTPGKADNDPTLLVKRMLSLEASNPLYQDMYAFPYDNKSFYSTTYKEDVVNDRKYLDLIEGKDENNDSEYFDNEKIMLEGLLELLVNVLYSEGGDKAVEMGKDNYFDYCMENSISSQLFNEYITLRCVQVGNINWAHTGIFPCQPVFTWYTRKGIEDLRRGLKRIEGYTYGKESDYEGDASSVLLYSSNSVHRNPLKIRGEYTLLKAIQDASSKDILAPINALVRISRFGYKKPTKIKLTEGMYFQPYDGKVSEVSSKKETDKYTIEEGFTGELKAIITTPLTIQDEELRAKFGLPSISDSIPMFFIYTAPNENYEVEHYKVDIFTVAQLGLKFKGSEKVGTPMIEVLNADINNAMLTGIASYQGPNSLRLMHKFGIESKSFSYPFEIMRTVLGLDGVFASYTKKDEMYDNAVHPSSSEVEKIVYSAIYNLTTEDLTSISTLIKFCSTDAFRGANIAGKLTGCMREIISKRLALNGYITEDVVQEVKVEEKSPEPDISDAIADPFDTHAQPVANSGNGVINSFGGFGNDGRPVVDNIVEGVEEVTPVAEGVKETTPVNNTVEEVTPVNNVVEEVTPVNNVVEETAPVNNVVEEVTPIAEESFGTPVATCEKYIHNNIDYVKVWFDKKPEDLRILELLKKNTFVWSGNNNFWYTKYNDFTLNAGQLAVKVYLGEVSIEQAMSKQTLPVNDTRVSSLEEEIAKLKEQLISANNKITELTNVIATKDTEINNLKSNNDSSSEVNSLKDELNSLREVALTITAEAVTMGEFDSSKNLSNSYGIKLFGGIVGVYEYSDGSVFVSSKPVNGYDVASHAFGRLFLFTLVGTVVKCFNNNKKITTDDEKLKVILTEQLTPYLSNASQYATEAAKNIVASRAELTNINVNTQLGKSLLSVGKLLGFEADLRKIMSGGN